MPRFYFDLTEDDRRMSDDTGLELESLEVARREAQRGLGEMVRDAMPDGEHKVIALTIREESGRTPITVSITMHVSRE